MSAFNNSTKYVARCLRIRSAYSVNKYFKCQPFTCFIESQTDRSSLIINRDIFIEEGEFIGYSHKWLSHGFEMCMVFGKKWIIFSSLNISQRSLVKCLKTWALLDLLDGVRFNLSDRFSMNLLHLKVNPLWQFSVLSTSSSSVTIGVILPAGCPLLPDLLEKREILANKSLLESTFHSWHIFEILLTFSLPSELTNSPEDHFPVIQQIPLFLFLMPIEAYTFSHHF